MTLEALAEDNYSKPVTYLLLLHISMVTTMDMTTDTTTITTTITTTTMRVVDNEPVALGMTVNAQIQNVNNQLVLLLTLLGKISMGVHGVSNLPSSCPGIARELTEPSASISKASTPV